MHARRALFFLCFFYLWFSFALRKTRRAALRACVPRGRLLLFGKISSAYASVRSGTAELALRDVKLTLSELDADSLGMPLPMLLRHPLARPPHCRTRPPDEKEDPPLHWENKQIHSIIAGL